MDKIDEMRRTLETWTKDRCPGNLGGGVHSCPANIPSCEDNMALMDTYALAVLEEAREACYACNDGPCHEDADGKTWCRPHVALRDRLTGLQKPK